MTSLRPILYVVCACCVAGAGNLVWKHCARLVYSLSLSIDRNTIDFHSLYSTQVCELHTQTGCDVSRQTFRSCFECRTHRHVIHGILYIYMREDIVLGERASNILPTKCIDCIGHCCICNTDMNAANHIVYVPQSRDDEEYTLHKHYTHTLQRTASFITLANVCAGQCFQRKEKITPVRQ